MKNGVFWVFLRGVRRLLVTASVVPSSSETSVLTRATRRNTSEDAILHTTLIVFIYSGYSAENFAHLVFKTLVYSFGSVLKSCTVKSSKI
jgi:hypothetical protein